ncbi:unnamed protein product [Colias eurytheme]|nr:unnamed protein product [Colias eurytheme]
MIRLNDNNFNGFLRTLLNDQQPDYTIVVVKDIDKHNSKEVIKQADELQQNLVIPDKALRFGDSSDSDSDFSIFPKDKEPKVYSDNDSIPIPRARRKCIFACKNAYRRVCRKFKYECSSRMRRYFKAECDDACEKRF